MTETDAVMDRLVVLVKEDAPLHDAVVRLINALAEEKETRTAERVRRLAK